MAQPISGKALASPKAQLVGTSFKVSSSCGSGSGSDSEDSDYVVEIEDEEWKASVEAIVKVDKIDESADKEVVDTILTQPVGEGHPTFEVPEVEEAPVEGGYSSYEDSDAEINSPGDSEEDDIRGNKYKLNVPIVTDETDWSKWDWIVGTRFPTRAAFKEAVRRYAVNNGRNLRISVSNRKRGGRIGVKCVDGCPFKLYCSVNEKSGCLMVKKTVVTHTCMRNMTKNRQLTTEFVATDFLLIFKTRPFWPAKEIQAAIKEKYKVFVTKWFAYKAKSSAHTKLHGSMKEHYGSIGSYLEMLRIKNPTSIFICFDGVKKGFLDGCRKVLCLDGCFLKTFLGGILLAVIGRDGNDQMYPVAWAVFEGENNDSWGWFMNELYKCLDVKEQGKGWTLISDQQKGLLNGVTQFWPNCEHRNCARHIYANWHKKHKGDDLKQAFWKAVKAYCEADYNIAIEELRQLDDDAATAFINQNPRSKHILHMLEDIRLAIMTRLRDKRTEMAAKQGDVCPRIMLKLEKEKNKSYKCEISISTEELYQVTYGRDDVEVDIQQRTCSCRKWDLTGIPCLHACAVFGFLKRPPENYVDQVYSRETYLKSYHYHIPPLPSQKFWPKVNFPLDPPPIKNMPGTQKNRRRDPHEYPKRPGRLTKHGMKMRCSGCKSLNHNIRKCPNKPKGGKAAVKKSKAPKDVEKTKKPRGRPRKIAKT
ncbi:hypothetical protein SSX86_001553 [Deinandra increscens subsp. villosa]|uniref:SWIM-type domain-containing protein n=1 Tax=Deinandra increscens subsp. villosa TaxID=3103831 RepID=A0AAP0DV21_9ASTR